MGPHVGLMTLFTDADLRRHGHADAQVCSVKLVGVDANAHRQALDDLGEVARGVVWRDSRIADATGRPQAFHGSLQYGTRQGVHLDVHRLSGPYTRRSEEHTSELQSLMRNSYAVFCLKKKIETIYTDQH